MHLFTDSQVSRKDGNEKVGILIVLRWGEYGKVSLCAPFVGCAEG